MTVRCLVLQLEVTRNFLELAGIGCAAVCHEGNILGTLLCNWGYVGLSERGLLWLNAVTTLYFRKSYLQGGGRQWD